MTQIMSQSIGQLPGGDLSPLGGTDPKDIKKAAQDFESFFVGQVFEEAHKAIPKSELFDGGMGMELYQSLFIQEAVKGAVQNGQGLGLAEYLQRHDKGVQSEVAKKDFHFDAPLPNLTQEIATKESLGMPLSSYDVSSTYGLRKDPFSREHSHHDGIDLKAPYGAPIKAAQDGKVTFAGVLKGYGKVIKIDHGDGLETLYAHNSKNHVTEGDLVKGGQVIGLIGSSGRSTGPHLHFEVLKDGTKVNPESLLDFDKNT